MRGGTGGQLKLCLLRYVCVFVRAGPYLHAARSEPGSSRGAGVPAWGRCSAGTTPPRTAPAPRGSLRWTWREPSLRWLERVSGGGGQRHSIRPQRTASVPLPPTVSATVGTTAAVQAAMCSSAELPKGGGGSVGAELRRGAARHRSVGGLRRVPRPPARGLLFLFTGANDPRCSDTRSLMPSWSKQLAVSGLSSAPH